MKANILFAFLTALASAGAAVSVQQSTAFNDGNDGGTDTSTGTIAFDIVTTDSVLVAGIYVDNVIGAYNFTTLNFGGQAPSASFIDGRVQSFLFLNPSTASGLFFNYTKVNTIDSLPNNSGIGIILYEVSGADLASIASATGSSTITTTTPNELVVSFAGRNGTASLPAENSPIFSGNDQTASVMTGGGVIASASGVAASSGVQNISWSNATDGLTAFSFKSVPEPSALLLGMGALSLLLPRRTRARVI